MVWGFVGFRVGPIGLRSFGVWGNGFRDKDGPSWLLMAWISLTFPAGEEQSQAMRLACQAEGTKRYRGFPKSEVPFWGSL